MRKIIFAFVALLVLTMASAEVIERPSIERQNTLSGDVGGSEKQTGTRELFRGKSAATFDSELDYRTLPPQQGKFYTSKIDDEVVEGSRGKYYESQTGVISGDLDSYKEGSLVEGSVQTVDRATRAYQDDENAPFVSLRRLFRVGSWFN